MDANAKRIETPLSFFSFCRIANLLHVGSTKIILAQGLRSVKGKQSNRTKENLLIVVNKIIVHFYYGVWDDFDDDDDDGDGDMRGVVCICIFVQGQC